MGEAVFPRYVATALGGLVTVAVAALLPYPRRKDMGQQPQQPKQPFDPNVHPNNPALPRDPSQRAFILKIAPLARQVQVLTGIPASVGIAQAIKESGWGESGLSKRYHNLHGAKTGDEDSNDPNAPCSKNLNPGPLDVPWQGVRMATQEERYFGSRRYRVWVYACFRVYNSDYDSFLDWALRFYRFALKDAKIKQALAYRRNWEAFLNAGGTL